MQTDAHASKDNVVHLEGSKTGVVWDVFQPQDNTRHLEALCMQETECFFFGEGTCVEVWIGDDLWMSKGPGDAWEDKSIMFPAEKCESLTDVNFQWMEEAFCKDAVCDGRSPS